MSESLRKKVKVFGPQPEQPNHVLASGVAERPLMLQLPPEIRCQIWRLLVVSPQVIKPRRRERIIQSNTTFLKTRNKHKKYYQVRKPTNLLPAFTCRAIYHEVTSLYYSENLFDLGNKIPGPNDNRVVIWNFDLERFARAIGQANFALIKRVRVDCTRIFVQAPRHWSVPLRRLGDFSHLQMMVQTITKGFRPDVKLIPFHRDEEFTNITKRQFEKALGKIQKMPLMGSKISPILVV